MSAANKKINDSGEQAYMTINYFSLYFVTK